MSTQTIYSSSSYSCGDSITLTRSSDGASVQARVVEVIYNPQPIQTAHGIEIRDMGRGYYSVEIPD